VVAVAKVPLPTRPKTLVGGTAMSLQLPDYCFVLGFVVGFTIRRLYAKPAPRDSVARSRRTVLDVATLSLVSIAMIGLPVLHLSTPWLDGLDYSLPASLLLPSALLGSLVFCLGLWLLWRAHVDLGRGWSAFPEVRDDQPLVTSGVYGAVRHPMYAATFLWAIAQALLLHNWLAGPAMIVTMVPFYMVRVGNEERLMLEHFGDEYVAYCARTGRLWPRVLGR